MRILRYFFIFFFSFASGLCFSQRLVLANDPYIVLSGGTAGTPIYIVLDNANANAITMSTAQVTGGIISESEFNMIKWNVGTTTGTYTVPFTKTFGGPIIPFSANITGAGVGAGNIKFSTYPGGTWDNFTYMPTGVTNMASAYAGGADNSEFVIDRFWITDANGYGTKPTASLTFTYIDAEMTPAGNTITEANLGAQRWAGTTWDAYVPQGTWSNLGTRGMVANAPAAPADFFRTWTLVDNTSPLPIELLSFEAHLNVNKVDLKWETATEINNDFFTVEKSQDGVNFQQVLTQDGAGNSTGILDYFDVDPNPFVGLSYYRLKQTDFNGSFRYSNIVPVEYNPNGEASISLFPNPSDGSTTFLALNQLQGQEVLVVLRDVAGRELFSKVIITNSNNELIAIDTEGTLAKGTYLITASSANNLYSKKLIVN